MNNQTYEPVYEFGRGGIAESIHYGAIAVVDAFGNLIAWYGDPEAVTYLRSTAKPFQVLPLLENGGKEYYNLEDRDIAIMSASHSGTDLHVEAVRNLQRKTGVSEKDLLCGTHNPFHRASAQALRDRHEKPTPNQHNCSGKHTGMLAAENMGNKYIYSSHTQNTYIELNHPVQKSILDTFAYMCGLEPENVSVGVDGCSAPNYAVPLSRAALAYARLCDPDEGEVQPLARSEACRQVTSAMMSHPDLIGGPGRFDTLLMEVTTGKIVAKRGAEGYQGVGVFPGAISPDSSSLGIALKIADGDSREKVRQAVTLEVLRQLGVLTTSELAAMAKFGPNRPVMSWRKIVVGNAEPIFELQHSAGTNKTAQTSTTGLETAA